MATRNLSTKYLALRNVAQANQQQQRAAAASSGGPRDEEAGLPMVEFSDQGAGGAEGAGPPAWVALHEAVTKDLNHVREQIRALQRLHATRLRVSFGDDVIAEQERSIEALSGDITSVLMRCENAVKKIALVGNDGGLSVQEKTTRINVMRSLATELSQASKQFRLCQKEYLHSLRAQEVVGEQFLSAADGVSRGVSLEDAVEHGLTAGQVAELALLEQQANSREKEIIRIAQSVNQLASLFRELNELVIEQGTVLDRIDYNVEQSLVKIQRGVADLEEAENASKKALTMKCIIILALICLLLFIVFVWRKS